MVMLDTMCSCLQRISAGKYLDVVTQVARLMGLGRTTAWTLNHQALAMLRDLPLAREYKCVTSQLE